MGKNQLIHGNEFHLLKQAEIHKATGKLVELEKRKEINDLLGISEPCETRVTEECFS